MYVGWRIYDMEERGRFFVPSPVRCARINNLFIFMPVSLCIIFLEMFGSVNARELCASFPSSFVSFVGSPVVYSRVFVRMVVSAVCGALIVMVYDLALEHAENICTGILSPVVGAPFVSCVGICSTVAFSV